MENRLRRTGFLVFALVFSGSLLFNLLIVNNRAFWPISPDLYEGLQWGDERIYLDAGILYVREGILKGRIEVFLVNCEHPPLSKILVGLLAVLLSPLRLGDYPTPIRVYSSLMLAILSFIVLNLGTKLFGYRSGLIAVALMLSQFFLQRGITYLSQLTHAHWLLASVNLTSLVFMSASLYFAYNFERGRNLWLTGLFYGLSMLSRFNTIPIVGLVLLIWICSRSDSARSTLRSVALIYLLGFAVLFLGDPVFWRLDFISTFFLVSKAKIGWGPDHSMFIWADFMGTLQTAPHMDFVVDETLRLIVYLLEYPAKLFQAMFLIPLFIVLLVTRRGRVNRSACFLVLLWLSTTFLFLDVLFKRAITYYPVDLIPALSLICAGLIEHG